MRSLLYVPAHSERFLSKAAERGADALILDLEDAVPDADKDAARDGLANWIPRLGGPVFVRLNGGARQTDDAVAALRAGAFGLVIAKAGDPRALESLAGTLREVDPRPLPFIALIEDVAAMLDARAIARVQRVMALAVGSEDLATALGAQPTPEVLRGPKLNVHYAAKAEGKLSFGLLRSIADYGDIEGLKAAALEARAHGFDGATCIHPSAVPVLNAAFAPSEVERDWARRVLEAAETRAGAFELDGKMVDAPVIARAKGIMASRFSA